jgi:ATP-dependent Clp protease protease subunit
MAAKRFYEIKNAVDAEATLSIFDEIGFWGTNAADFRRDLEAVTAPVINLQINSPGGSVFDGIAIYNLLKASGKTIKAKVMGVAASIASVILMAADEIDMPANTMLMVHAPSGGVFGTATEMRDMADVLDKVQASLVATYVSRTGKSDEEIAALLVKDTWLTAAEAKDMGFADSVSDAVELTASFDMDDERLPEAARVAFKAAADLRSSAEAAAAADAAAAAEAQRVEAERVEAERIEALRVAAVATWANQVKALATDAGFAAHAAAWAVRFTKPEEVTARIAEVREIKDLFALAGKGTEGEALIVAHKSLAEARTELQTLIAAGDQHIDTTKPANEPQNLPTLNAKDVYAKRAAVKDSEKPTTAGPSAVNTAAIWAKRNKQSIGV